MKADGYGHGATAVGRAALRAGARAAVRRDVGGGPRPARGAGRRAGAGDGAARPGRGGARGRRGRGRHVGRGLRAAARPRRARRSAFTSRSIPAWAGGEWPPPRRCASPSSSTPTAASRSRGLMSHLAVADTDDAFTPAQVERFAGGRRAASRPARATSRTAPAALRFPEARFDAVRCGIAIYGISPFGADPDDRRDRAGAAAREHVADGEAARGRARAPATAAASSPTRADLDRPRPGRLRRRRAARALGPGRRARAAAAGGASRRP